MKIIIVGGGPAGMLAAISAKKKFDKKEDEVILLEKNDTLGKKLRITGKGRCNITSSLPIEDFMKNIATNDKFMYSAFSNFTNKDIIDLLGIEVKEERGNRIFPKSDKAEEVVNALRRKLESLNVDVRTNVKLEDIVVEENKENKKVIGIITNKGKLDCDKLIIATGGKSYPGTGSTGECYDILKKHGHKITDIKGSLVGLSVGSEYLSMVRSMQGLSLRNVAIKVYENNKVIYEDFGELMFTHFGISGPVILSASAHIVKTKMRDVKVSIDLKPALDEKKLDDRILRDFEKYKHKEIKNALNDLLPQKMILPVIEMANIPADKKLSEITKKERENLRRTLKNFVIEIKDLRPVEEAIITHGGINVKEVNPKTMESKIIKNLYLAGEILDVDAYTGGFNLQIAYSTGYTAGMLL